MSDNGVVISVIIVTWNTREALDLCLASLRRHAPAATCEIIVVDNRSADGTAAMVRERYPEVRLIEAGRNLGFAGGNNRGAAVARGRYLLFLNNDTEATPGAFDAMVGVFAAHRTDRRPVGAVGCRLRYPDGRLQRSARRFPTFAAACQQFTILRHLGVFDRVDAEQKMEDFDFATERPVEALMGAALMVARGAYETIGGWDERYPFRYEDADFAVRLHRAGYVSLYSPCGEVVHHSGVATKKMRRQRQVFLRGLFHFFRQTRGPAATWGFKVLFAPLYLARLFYDIPVNLGHAAARALRGRPDRARQSLAQAREDFLDATIDLWRLWTW